MIVADASAIVELLLGTPGSEPVREKLAGSEGEIHASALLDVEVAQVVRRLHRAGRVDDEHGSALIELLQALPVHRHRMDPLLPRIWALRANLTAYDAAYVALAEALRCPLLTLDERIRSAPGITAEIVSP